MSTDSEASRTSLAADAGDERPPGGAMGAAFTMDGCSAHAAGKPTFGRNAFSTEAVAPVIGGWNRSGLAVLAMAVGGLAIGTAEFASMGLLPEIASGLHVTEPEAGHVISAYALGVVFGAPLIAAFLARVPRKLLLVGLMVVITLGNVASALATSYASLVAARFVAGLPHGAYYGVATLVAAQLMGPHHRAKAAALVMSGLTVATVVGVPTASWLGRAFGWRAAFGLVVVVSTVAVAALGASLPRHIENDSISALIEIGVLRRLQVWLALAVGMIGVAGVFAVYTYVSTTLTEVTGVPGGVIPLALLVFGVGMVVGNLVGGRLADVSVVGALYATLCLLVVAFVSFVVVAHHPVAAVAALFFIGIGGGAGLPSLQTRLMDVGCDGQTAAAALNHSAINFGNALGAWLGGLVIAAGYGYTAPAIVAVGLAVAGIAIVSVSVWLQRPVDDRRR